MKPIYVFLANGFEDIEAITVIDLLRRWQLPAVTVSINPGKEVTSVNNNTIIADEVISESLPEASWLVFPGGMPGAENLHENKLLNEMLRKQAESSEGRIAAICAAPAIVLGQEGYLKGEKATCYPGMEGLLMGAEHVDAPVVVSGKYVLGNGPANAMLWALTIVKEILGEEEAHNLAQGLLFYNFG